MKLESILKLAVACFLTLALSVVAFGQDQSAGKNQNNQNNSAGKQPKADKSADRVLHGDHVVGTTRDEEKQSRKAADLFKEVMKTPAKGIPQSVFDRAECVMAFPGVYRSSSTAATIGGRGMISCRTSSGWSPPVYLNISGDNVGSQIVPGPSDLVMLFMSKDIVNSLPNGKFTVGADASAAPGPVGQDPGASAGATTNAQILCYSRGKGQVAGVALDGVSVEVALDDMRDVYGDNFNPKGIMEGVKVKAPSKVMAFSETLSRHAPRQARK
ncbi:MAG: lipid-binding SYLF domain-containing protein [Blastocatellales bacterium]